MKICPKCNHKNKDTSKFCEECGEKFVSSPKSCPECGTQLEGSPKFCPECGYNFVTGEASLYNEDDDELEIQERIAGTYSYDSEEIFLSIKFRNDNSCLYLLKFNTTDETKGFYTMYEVDDFYDVTIFDVEGHKGFSGSFSEDCDILQLDSLDVVLKKDEIDLEEEYDSQIYEETDSLHFLRYRQAANQGNVEAQYLLAECYSQGKGTKENEEEAFEWYKKAAEQGYAKAQNCLAQCYYDGRGTETNEEEAFEWFKKAAEQGYAEAQCNLAQCYSYGRGTETNEEEAFGWFKKATEQGYAEAQYYLSHCYSAGRGTEINEKEAFKWVKKAVENGYHEAQLSLMECYEYGLGTEPDKKAAQYWKEKYLGKDESCDDDSSNDYEEYVDEDEYENDKTKEEKKEKIKKIVDKYLPTISKESTYYRSGAVQNSEYSQVFQNVRSKIATDTRQTEILGFIDNTVFGKGKTGLVFTTDALYEGSTGALWKIPYSQMGGMELSGKKITFHGTEDCGIGLLSKNMDITVNNIYYNLPALKDCLEEIYQVI